MLIRLPLCAAMSVFAAALMAFGQAPATVDAVVDATAQYVKNYQTQLTSVVAEETYTQQVPHAGLVRLVRWVRRLT